MVRLKANSATTGKGHFQSFNSNMVRLKGRGRVRPSVLPRSFNSNMVRLKDIDSLPYILPK